MGNRYGDMHGQGMGMVNELVRGMGTNVSVVDGNISMRENGYDGYSHWAY